MVEQIIDFLGKYLSGWLGYLIVFLACFGENSVGLGLVVPGETLVILGGVYASNEAHAFLPPGAEPLVLPLVTLVAIVGAILGDNTGYLIGRRFGRSILEGHGPRWLFPPDRLASADAYYREHGGKTVFLGRFVPVVRSFGCLIAGISKMPWRRFVGFDATGAIIWATGHTLLGYILGSAFLRNKNRIEGYLTWFGLVILVGLIAAVVLSRRRRGRRHANDSGEGPGGGEEGESD